MDGGWSRWSPWSRCDKRCGGGRSIRTRSCSSPPPKNGGKKCEGEKNQVKPCNTKPCGETPPPNTFTHIHCFLCMFKCLLIQHLSIFRHVCVRESAQTFWWNSLQHHKKSDLLPVICQMRKDARWARSSRCVPTSVHSAVQTCSRA